MKLFRIFIAIFFLISMAEAAVSEIANEESGVIVIYLLDISGSMNKDGLFQNIKNRLKQLILERKQGDRIVLVTFGKDVLKVLDVEIHNPEDLKEIVTMIDNLQAVSPWTWMSKAFQRVKELADIIREKSPKKKILIYLLTDCDNDPPPDVKKEEPPWKFVEVLTRHFKDFHVQDAYVYLLAYRSLTENEKEAIRETAVMTHEPDLIQPMPRLVLEPTGFDFGEVDLEVDNATIFGEITVKKIEGVPPGEIVSLSTPQEVIVQPPKLICWEVDQQEKIALTFSSDLDPGTYGYSITLKADHAIVEPQEIKISFMIPNPSEAIPPNPEPPKELANKENSVLNKILIGLMILLGTLILLRHILASPSTKMIWIHADEGEVHEALLQEKQKLWFGIHSTQTHLNLGLPDYYLELNKGNIFLCENVGGEKFRVPFDEEIPCKGKDDVIVTVKFYENRPREVAYDRVSDVKSGRPEGPMDII